MSPDADPYYDGTMLGALRRHAREGLRSRAELIPFGYNWSFILTVDLALVVVRADIPLTEHRCPFTS